MDYVIPVLEAVGFLIPFIVYVNKVSKNEQRQEDRLEHLEARCAALEGNHVTLATLLHNIENNLTRVETKIDLIIGGKLQQ